MLTPIQIAILLEVDSGYCHAVRADIFSAAHAIVAEDLTRKGYLRRLPETKRFEERYVLTGRGSHAIGTFDSDQPETLARARWTNRKRAA